MKEYVFGVDLGGTTVKMGLFGSDGALEEKWEIPTDTSNDGANILKDIAEAIQKKLDEKEIDKSRVEGIGIGIPGPVNSQGVVDHCVNLGWGVVPVARDLEKLTGLPVQAGNDANVAAMGEAFIGAAKDAASSVMITLGTGVGAGIVVNGRILIGENGAAGEFGHIHVNDDETEACGCGNHGCLEQYASATCVVRLANRRLAKDDAPSSLRDLEKVTSKDVFDAAKAGDAVAKEIVHEVCTILGKAIAKLCNIVNPAMVVIGGGVSNAGPILIKEMQDAFQEEVFHGARGTRIELATLGNDAGIAGGAGMVIEAAS
ncbi:MAG: ROK family glucokinase [Lachnospiraceae bacterium]|nr:ROK family glucokinase [Lachnospiraceae bacterium]